MGSKATERAEPPEPLTPRVPGLPNGFEFPALNGMVAVPSVPIATSTVELSGEIATWRIPEPERVTGCSWLDCRTPVLGLTRIAKRLEVPENPSTSHELVESTCMLLAGSDEIGCPELPSVSSPEELSIVYTKIPVSVLT